MTPSQEAWTLSLSAPTERDLPAEIEAHDGWEHHKDSGLRHIDAKLIDAKGHIIHLCIRAHISEYQEGPHPSDPQDRLITVITEKFGRLGTGVGITYTEPIDNKPEAKPQ